MVKCCADAPSPVGILKPEAQAKGQSWMEQQIVHSLALRALCRAPLITGLRTRPGEIPIPHGASAHHLTTPYAHPRIRHPTSGIRHLAPAQIGQAIFPSRSVSRAFSR